MDIKQIKQKGFEARERVDTPGTLRGGTIGILFEDGMYTGECLRKAYLRYLGITTQHNHSKQTTEL